MATIKDVARECGLSAATVSYVLNDTRAVRPQTRERVLSAVRRMDYHPSAVARGLSRKRMDNIGVMFPRTADSPVSNPFYSLVLDGLLAAATHRRQTAMLLIGAWFSEPNYSLSLMRDGRCDGIIMIAPHEDTESVATLAASGLPFVMVGYRDRLGVSRVDVDDSAAAKSAVEYLISIGHKRIAYVTRYPLETAPFARERCDGWSEALTAAGLTESLDLRWAGRTDWGKDGDRAVQAILSMPEEQRPTAVLAGSDEVALCLLQRFADSGVRVPDEISVMGFDDVIAAETSTPPLTTVRQPLREIGAAAVEILLAHIDGTQTSPEVRILPTEIVVRASTAPPSR